jgi:tetratricopeptide (TPR) repeat protein
MVPAAGVCRVAVAAAVTASSIAIAIATATGLAVAAASAGGAPSTIAGGAPPPGVPGGTRGASGVAARTRVRLVFEREDLMPPHRTERVRLRALATTREGIPEVTRIVQVGEVNEGMVATEVLSVPGEDLASVKVEDMNDDGIKEVLLAFSPPRNQSIVRLVLLSFSGLERRYRKVWEEGPAAGLSARFALLAHRRGTATRWGLAVDRLPRDGRGAPETSTYELGAEKLSPVGRTGPEPSAPPDLLAWGIEWSRRGDLDRALAALSRAAASLTGTRRLRAWHELARVQIARKDLAGAAGTARLVVTAAGDSPYGLDARRMLSWIGRTARAAAGTREALAAVAGAQLALDGGRFETALDRAASVLAAGAPVAPARAPPAPPAAIIRSASPWADEALMIQAQAYMALDRTREAVRCLRSLVAEHPASPHVAVAQSWLIQLAPSGPDSR